MIFRLLRSFDSCRDICGHMPIPERHDELTDDEQCLSPRHSSASVDADLIMKRALAGEISYPTHLKALLHVAVTLTKGRERRCLRMFHSIYFQQPFQFMFL